MAQFVFAGQGGASAHDEEDSARLVDAWANWMGGLGITLRDPGSPARASRTVHADGLVTDGGGVNPVTGYTIVEAADFEEAISLTSGCPIFDVGGSIEILEME